MTAFVLLATVGLAAQFLPLQEDFDSGAVGREWKINLGSTGSYARFEPRDGGKCLHLFGDHAGAVLVTRKPLANLAYTLEYDFYQPGDEARGYQAVVQHTRPEGNAYWWLEYGPGRFFLYTVAGGQWYNRWQGSGLAANRWYHIRVRNTPVSVRVRIYDEAGKNLLRQSGTIPHDTGTAGPLVFSATGTDKGAWGMKIDNLSLAITPVAERDDYRHRRATVEAAEKTAATEGVLKLWPGAQEALKPVRKALVGVEQVEVADWAAYVAASKKLDVALRVFGEQYHAKVVAKLPQRQGHWVTVDLWQHFDAEASALGLQAPMGAPLTVVKDVPFVAVPFGRNCLWQDEGSRSQRAIRLKAAAKQIALLLAPRYNTALYSHDDSLVDVLQVELRYQDGQRERVVPVPMGWKPEGPGGVGRPRYDNARVGVYLVTPGHVAPLRELVLCDDATQAGWALLGLSYEAGLPERRAIQQSGVRLSDAPRRAAARVLRTAESLTLSNPSLRLELSASKGLVTRLFSPFWGDALLPAQPSPYFAVRVGDSLVYSDDFAVTAIQAADRPDGAAVTLTLRGPKDLAALEARVTIALGEDGRMTWKMRLDNLGEKPLRARLIFPLLDGLDLGKEPGWFFPQRGGAASNLPFEGLSSYGGMAWLQMVDAWRDGGGGLYLRSDDTGGMYKILALRSVPARESKPRHQADIPKPAHPVEPWRAPAGVHLSLQYLPRELKPGASWEPPAATLCAHPGDWHAALSDYRQWLGTWWKPLRPCPERYRYGFYALVGGAPRDDQKGEEFGSYDWWHLGGTWSIDYPDELKLQLAEWRKQAQRAARWGQAVGLYIEGMVMEKKQRIAREHGAEWAMMDDQGHYYTYYSRESNPVWNLCPAVRAWQQWDAWAYSELAKRLPLCALYVDSLGSRWAEVCYNPAHHHDTPGIWPRGCAELFESIRQAVMKVSPGTAIHSEEPGCDYMALHEDGSWSHSLWTALSGDAEYNPAGLNYFHFALPRFKMYEIPSYRHGLWRCKLAFFNGEGLWTNVPDELRRELFIKWMPTLRENADTFQSDEVTPALPVVKPPLYMNRFRRDDRAIYTVYNAGLRTIGAKVTLPLPAGGHVFDLLGLREMTFTPRRGRATLALSLAPHEVLCFAIGPRLARAELRGKQLQVTRMGAWPAGSTVIVAAIGAEGQRLWVRSKTPARGAKSVTVALADGPKPAEARKLLVRLALPHDTRDELSLPSSGTQ